jgi:hypothetical protein
MSHHDHEEEPQIAIGDRVVAVNESQGTKLFVFGRGIFEGYFLKPDFDLTAAITDIQAAYAAARSVTPDLPETFTEDEARKAIILSQSLPRIHLTETIDGQPLDEVIWGNECWLTDEKDFAERTPEGKYTLVTKNLAEYREEAAKMEAFKTALFGAGGALEVVEE